MKPTVSLTFDDGMISQRDIALPILRANGLQATFFLPSRLTKIREWGSVDLAGMEIGAHSVTHGHGHRQNAEEVDLESRGCHALEAGLAVPVETFAYPYAEHTAIYEQALIARAYKCARGGHRAQDNKYMRTRADFNRYNVPCFQINNTSADIVPGLVDEAIRKEAWLVLMFHAVSPDPKEFDCILPPRFTRMCQELNARQKRGLEVKTFISGFLGVPND